MKPGQFIHEYGVEKARKVVEGAPSSATTARPSLDFKHYLYGRCENAGGSHILLSDLKRLVESLDLVEKLGGYGKCKFYMTGMKLNKCDSVKCPKTGLIVSRAALEIAINDYRESIYGGGGNA